MRTFSVRLIAAATLLVVAALPTTARAAQQKQQIATADIIDRAIAARAATQQDTRDAIVSLMKRPQVQEVARKLGLQVTTVEAAVGTLDAAELDRLAVPVRQAERELAGGQTLIISTTTLLLIIIIIILIAD